MSRTDPSTAPLGQSHSEWWRVTLGSIADAVVTTDMAGNVTFLNALAESLTGWTSGDALGLPLGRVFSIVDQSSGQVMESPTVQALRSGLVAGLATHTLLIAKSGAERPIDYSAAPIRDGGSEAAGVVLVFRNIAERHEHEQVLADAAAYASNIIATLREPFLVLDRSLCVHTANRAFYETFRVVEEETVGNFIYDLGNAQWNIPVLREVLQSVLADDRPVHDFDVQHNFPVIGWKHLLLNASRFQSSYSHPDLILLAFEDVTARKHAEQSVHTSELRYRRLFQTSKDGILILDGQTFTIVDANPFMTELLGYALDELLGKELWEFGFFRDKRASQAAYKELQAHGYMRYEHLPLETKRGERADVEFVCNTYQVDGRDVAQCNIRDISERTRMEKKIAEQTLALADLHRRKDEFLAMLGHELRNPLAPIANAVELLRLQPTEAPLQRDARTIIERQMAQLTRLVDDLLEISRINTGRVSLRLETVDLNDIVRRSIETVLPLMQQHRHAFTAIVPGAPIWVSADAARFEQVLINLLNNAAKYTLDGGIITLSVQQIGEQCVVRVRDTGIGIGPELIPSIFDLFTQAERSLDRSQGGLGIGLSLVQRLVELHSGHVEAHSTVGVGSEFIVRLPVVPAAPLAKPSLPHSATLPSAREALRILVVDDNVDATETLRLLLTAIGHDVRTAHTGPEALEVAAAFTPDAALLDIGLPELDGYQVAKRIRLQPANRTMMLIAMTGYGQDGDRQRAFAAGFDHHLVKPTEFRRVLEILATVVEKCTTEPGEQ